jgi:CheY-like chemotaxis protein
MRLQDMAPQVLIIDDNALNLKLTSDVLRGEGFAVQEAQDAEEARDILKRGVPDLILLDIALPGMDGLTLTRLLKAEARLSHIPIVALTASAMKGDEDKALAAGCVGYITKPIDTRRFGSLVRKFLPPGVK